MSVANFNRLIDNLHTGRGKGVELLTPSDVGIDDLDIQNTIGITWGNVLDIGGLNYAIIIVQLRFTGTTPTAGTFNVPLRLIDKDGNQLADATNLFIFNAKQELSDADWIMIPQRSGKANSIGGTAGNASDVWSHASRIQIGFDVDTKSDAGTAATANIYVMTS